MAGRVRCSVRARVARAEAWLAQDRPWRTVHASSNHSGGRRRGALAATVGTAEAGADSGCDQDQGLRPMRRQHRPRRLLQSRRRRQLVGPRRRRLPRRRRRAVRRRRGGQVHAADRQGAVHRAAVGRGRRAVAQHDLDARARHRARPRLRRRDLLRRPGLHGAEGARRQERARARRRLGLRPDRHDHRAQPRRLLPRQQHVVRAGRLRAPGRDRARPTSRAAATSTPPTSPASTPSAPVSPSPTTTSSCPR